MASQEFLGLEWGWTSTKTFVNTYCKMLSEFSFMGVITQLSDHFVTVVYKMIFEQDPLYLSRETMEALIKIEDLYASPYDTFIQMYNAEKPLHVLPKFFLDKLVMQEVSFHISTRFTTRLH